MKSQTETACTLTKKLCRLKFEGLSKRRAIKVILEMCGEYNFNSPQNKDDDNFK